MGLNTQPLLNQSQVGFTIAIELGCGEIVIKGNDFSGGRYAVAQFGLLGSTPGREQNHSISAPHVIVRGGGFRSQSPCLTPPALEKKIQFVGPESGGVATRLEKVVEALPTKLGPGLCEGMVYDAPLASPVPRQGLIENLGTDPGKQKKR